MQLTNKFNQIQSRLKEEIKRNSLNLHAFFDECNIQSREEAIQIQLVLREILLDYLNSTEFDKFKSVLQYLSRENDKGLMIFAAPSNLNEFVEGIFYQGLSRYLELKEFESFKELVCISDKVNIFLTTEKIPDRLEILSKLIVNYIRKLSESYHTESLGEIIESIRFFNQFNLLTRDFTGVDISFIEETKRDHVFCSNLKDLFNTITDPLIYYIRMDLPRIFYDFFINNPNPYFPEPLTLVHYIKDIFLNQYAIYGLSVKNLGNVVKFLEGFEEYLKIFHQNSEGADKLIEYSVEHKYRTYSMFNMEYKNTEYKRHLLNHLNLKKNFQKIRDEENYNFYCISMVILGGLGPQGHGFTYSTPKGELIEICSDRKEHEAIIIKYKQFLKQQFLEKLKKELMTYNIGPSTIEKILSFLNDLLKNKELINIYKKELIINQLHDFLYENFLQAKNNEQDYDSIIEQISKTITIILRPINLVDQFKCRMELIAQNKVKSEDIAKLTSLRGKSHYDVLRERFFYQYVISWFFQLFKQRRMNILNKF